MWSFFSTLLLLLLFFLFIVLLLATEHSCYLLLCWPDLSLTRCLSLYSSFLRCAIEWNCSPVVLNTTLLVIHLACEVPGSTLSFHGLSRFQRVPWYPTNIVSTSLKLLLLLVVPCHKFHNSFLLVVLFLIKMLLVSIFCLVPGIVLFLLHVLRCLFLF